MNMFIQDSQAVLFILKLFGRPLPPPSTILPNHPDTTEVESVTFCGQFFALSNSHIPIIVILQKNELFQKITIQRDGCNLLNVQCSLGKLANNPNLPPGKSPDKCPFSLELSESVML